MEKLPILLLSSLLLLTAYSQSSTSDQSKGETADNSSKTVTTITTETTEAPKPKIDAETIKNGDCSSVVGVWRNNLGNEYVINSDGSHIFNNLDGTSINSTDTYTKFEVGDSGMLGGDVSTNILYTNWFPFVTYLHKCQHRTTSWTNHS